MARLRKGRANTARGAANFLRETGASATPVPRERSRCGPTAASMPTPSLPSVAVDVRFSITIRHAPPTAQIKAIPLDTHTLLDGRRRPFTLPSKSTRRRTSAPHLRRVKPTPGSQLLHQLQLSRFLNREGDTLQLEATTGHAEVENIRDLKYGVGLNHLPSGNAAWLAVQVMLTIWLDLTLPELNWKNEPPPPRPCADGSSPSPDGLHARPAVSPCIFPSAGPGKHSSTALWPDCEPFRYRADS